MAFNKRRSITLSTISTKGGVFVSIKRALTKKNVAKPSTGRKSSSLQIKDEVTECTSSSTLSDLIASWKTAGSKDHHKGTPLIVQRPESSSEFDDEIEALDSVLSRSKKLPGPGWYFSIHVVVNQERIQRAIAPMVRSVKLDELARKQAEKMAAEGKLFHSDTDELLSSFDGKIRRLGENVACGKYSWMIQKSMMTTKCHRNNILDRRFTDFGVATAKGKDGQIYMCQIFRG